METRSLLGVPPFPPSRSQMNSWTCRQRPRPSHTHIITCSVNWTFPTFRVQFLDTFILSLSPGLFYLAAFILCSNSMCVWNRFFMSHCQKQGHGLDLLLGSSSACLLLSTVCVCDCISISSILMENISIFNYGTAGKLWDVVQH